MDPNEYKRMFTAIHQSIISVLLFASREPRTLIYGKAVEIASNKTDSNYNPRLNYTIKLMALSKNRQVKSVTFDEPLLLFMENLAQKGQGAHDHYNGVEYWLVVKDNQAPTSWWPRNTASR